MKKLEKYFLTPLIQGSLSLAIFLILIFLNYLAERSGFMDKQPMNIWLFATSLIFFYIMMSSIFCFNAVDRMGYYRNAIFTYVALVLFICVCSSFLSGIALKDAATHSWIIYVLSIVFIVFMVIISLIRKIVDLALKQNDHPKY